MKNNNLSPVRLSLWLLLAAGLCRLLSLGLYPLSDKTESRYGEIARIMVETGNWVTPHVDYGVPFWGKPPLATWASALGVMLFGENEFAVRLPMLLLTAGAVWLLFLLVRSQKGSASGLGAALILAASPMFFAAGGGVMTDPALVLGTTMSMVGFYQALFTDEKQRLWGYLFFAGLGIGLLAKGPVAIVLTGVPIFLWMVWQRNWRLVWQRLPWLTGLALTCAIALPWYLLAESRTPGFLDYFIVGEHWKRFVEPGWSGDLYGGAHSRPRGMIWLFWLLTAFPWSLLVLFAFFSRNRRRQLRERMGSDRNWSRYLLLWTIAPMLFFTMAGNILWTYVLPGLPAFSALLVTLFQADDAKPGRLLTGIAQACIALYVVAVLVLATGLVPFKKSQRELVSAFQAISGEGSRLVYPYSRPYSAQFYSGGTAMLLETVSGTEALFRDQTIDYLALRPAMMSSLPQSVADRLELQGEFVTGFNLYREKAP